MALSYVFPFINARTLRHLTERSWFYDKRRKIYKPPGEWYTAVILLSEVMMIDTHTGHRERVRTRYMQEGLDGFAPHEVLELILFYCIPHKNVNTLAHALIDTFGSLAAVFEASPRQLMKVKGIGEHSAILLSTVPSILKKYQESLINQKYTILTRNDAYRYCGRLFIGCKTEHFRLVALNAAMQVTGNTLLATGSLTEVPAYPRVVVEAALLLNAHSVILCHNHPSDVTEPSGSDIAITEKLARLLRDIHISLLDHIIVSHAGAISINSPYTTHNNDYEQTG